ncbi:hypothetical protein SEA_PRAIRIE_54 [Arthrobacter phage Prairie]|uniref:Uncharacterized protein n=1 Tax=Arthrobacter phage Prairie TaxID=2816463 RepID=A0A8A5LLK5_9CAUD|nr:hypothetical protein SEA_PRAIRIE_54 [Arthrobacter phage Prairie]
MTTFTVQFDQASLDAAIPPLSLITAPSTAVLASHVAAYLKPKDRRNFTIEYTGGQAGAVVLGGRLKADKIRRLVFEVEFTAPVRRPEPAPRTYPDIVPPKWSKE